MPTLEDVKTWRGKTVVDSDGDKIGTLEDIYLDRQSGDPEWAVIKTGMLGTKVSFAPLEGASPSGEELRIGYDKAKVKDAPSVDADGELSEQEEQRLYEYYGRDYGDWDRETDRTEATLGRDERFYADRDVDATSRDRDLDIEDRDRDRGTVGRDTSGPETDDAMTRSEEELRVGKTQRETGRARLRKYIVSENVTQTVPVQREEVRIEREPITDANIGDATSGGDLTEEEHEVTLHQEEAVVDKRVVPKERVRLDKDVVQEERQVNEEVRKEVIETEGDMTERGGRDRI